MSRETREALLRWWALVGVPAPSYVIKTFEDMDEAEKYILDIQAADKIIDNL